MNKVIHIAGSILIFSSLACGLMRGVSQPQAAVAPLSISGDLTKIDVCQAIPPEDIEAVLGRKLVNAPQAFEYTDTGDTRGCSYDAGKDSDGNAYFGYIVLTPPAVYDSQPLYESVEVQGLGESAYFNNGADARQLWVKVNEKVAFVVAFGDQPREEGAQAMARLILAALQ